jgi:hypothetical protein
MSETEEKENPNSTIMVSKETLAILQRVSTLAHIPISSLVKEWSQSLEKWLKENNPERINIMSCYDEKNDMIHTYLARVVFGQSFVNNLYGDETVEDEIVRKFYKPKKEIKKK